MQAEMMKLGQDLILYGHVEEGKNLLHEAIADLDGEILADLIRPDHSPELLSQADRDFILSRKKTPERYEEFLQKIWHKRELKSQATGGNLVVSPELFLYTQDEIQRLEVEGRRIGFMPEGLSSQANRHVINTISPHLHSLSVQKVNFVTNDVDRHGYYDYDATIFAPYKNTTERQLRNIARRQKRTGLTLNQFAVAALDTKLFDGQYLDEDSNFFVRLLDSRYRGRVVAARFLKDGHLVVVSDFNPKDHIEYLGGRLAGVPKLAKTL